MKLESGPAKADRNWQILRAALFLGFGLWFIYDGAAGYPKKNRAEAEKLLQAPPFKGTIQFDALGEMPTKAAFDAFMQTNPTRIEQVHEALGAATFTDGNDEYFISRYGYAKVTVRAGLVRPADIIWRTWAKTESDIRGQFYWAIVPILPGLYFLLRLYKAVTLRVVIDEEGMTYDTTRVPFDRMVSLRDYSPKGWIDLYYQTDGLQKKLRLDNEKVKLFDEIVDAICRAKGFPNEVKAYQEKKAREAAEDDEATDETDAPAPGSSPDEEEVGR